jgi:hypothetical protein
MIVFTSYACQTYSYDDGSRQCTRMRSASRHSSTVPNQEEVKLALRGMLDRTVVDLRATVSGLDMWRTQRGRSPFRSTGAYSGT